MNDIELIDEIVKRAEEHQKQREKEFAIAEIKKLKEEIHDVISACFLDKKDIHAIQNVFDEHIAKLKGE